MWKARREGIDDGRYLYTLEHLVDRAKQKGGKAAEIAQEGQKELDFLGDAIEVQEKY